MDGSEHNSKTPHNLSAKASTNVAEIFDLDGLSRSGLFPKSPSVQLWRT